jgi:hypothetical protein
MLERVKCPAAIVPAFIWSQKHCEAIQWSDSDVVAWGYPLQSMWKKFPRWNSSNTVIVDHKPQCVNRNPDANVILATPFYVQELTNIGDDGQFLKTSLWPQLRGLFGSAAPADFERQCPNPRQKEQAHAHYEQKDNKNISGPNHSLQGEGTYEPHGSTRKLSPHLPLSIIINFLFLFSPCIVEARAVASEEGRRVKKTLERIKENRGRHKEDHGSRRKTTGATEETR